MAQLSSPGVSVSVIDESFYTPAAPGTVPLIVVATEQDKSNSSGTGTAPGTLQSNAGKVYLLTSQKDLADNFGTPVFKTDISNNPIHAGEQNEYGLQAAYSFLGVSNRAYVVRADMDLGQLMARSEAPAGDPDNGQYWFDTSTSKFGLFQWSAAAATAGGQSFSNVAPLVITSSASINAGAPLTSIGKIGDYAIVKVDQTYKLWFKKARTSSAAGTWVAVGSADWAASWPTAQGTTASGSITLLAGDVLTITVNSTPRAFTGHTSLTTLVQDINTALDYGTYTDSDPASGGNQSGLDFDMSTIGISAAIVNDRLEIYSKGSSFALSGTSVTKVGLTVGTYYAPVAQISAHYTVPTYKASENASSVNGRPTGSVWLKTTEPNLGAAWRVKVYSSLSNSWSNVSAPMYKTSASAIKALDPKGGGINLAQGALYIKSNVDESLTSGFDTAADFKIYARRTSGVTSIVSDVTTIPNATYTFKIAETVAGSNVLTKGAAPSTNELDITFTVNNNAATAFVSALTAALVDATHLGSAYTSRITASVNTAGNVVITHLDGGDIYFKEGSGNPIAAWFTPYSPTDATTTTNFYSVTDELTHTFVASLWSPYADITPSSIAPTTTAADTQLWYSSIVDEVDIMIHDGAKWAGYREVYADTNPTGPIVSATAPLVQTDGTVLVANDLWIDTSDLENYPKLYKRTGSGSGGKWVLVDTTDDTTTDGILFADARWSVAGADITPATIVQLLTSHYVDADAPDPALYPRGIMLWNLRRSGNNVKKFVRNHVNLNAINARVNESMSAYYPHRWVTESGNQENGAGTFGRKAQRKVVIQALQSLVNTNQQIRDEESRIFNLLACPGYPELTAELVSLNTDRGLTSFVVADTPARLTPDATTLSNWGSNVANALEDNDTGLVTSDEYLGVFYPWGYTSDNLGNNIVVPPSHMILRTIALNDQVSYPWFAPAGTRRGGITNASAVGYVDKNGEFQSIALNNGQRDTLASVKVNPITFITGTGLVNYGQYTRAKNASSLDRINVARLVIYLRRQLAQLAKPYVFEPNDKITRDELKGAAESLLLELVGQRALYDYVVVCDTSNNTPTRIDRNELYLDIAIEPVKAVEFIYIPLRLKNTGEIKGLNNQ
jgi:hypothetical protein